MGVNLVTGMCRNASQCAAESKLATNSTSGAVGCALYPEPVQCCTASPVVVTTLVPVATVATDGNVVDAKFVPLYPLIVGDVDATKASFSYRTKAAKVRFDIRPRTPDAKIAPIAVTVPAAPAAIASIMEAELGMLPLVPASSASRMGARAHRVSVFARTHTLQYVPAAMPSATPLAIATLELLGDKCYIVTLLGEGTTSAPYRALLFEDPCPTISSDNANDQSYVRFFSTKPGVTVKELKPADADRVGVSTTFAAKATTFTSSEGKAVTQVLEKGHAYVVAVAYDSSLRVISLGDIRGDVSEARNRIARLYVLDGMAEVAAPVILTSSLADQAQNLKDDIVLSSNTDRTASFWVDSLTPNTEYVATVTGMLGEAGSSARFRTAGDPTRKVTFGVTSCLGPDDRPWTSLTHASKANLDFFVLGGDTVYADGSRLAAEFRATWSDALKVQGIVDLFSSTSIVAAWDDHETNDDWDLENTPSGVALAARRAYKEGLPAFYGRSSSAAAAEVAYAYDSSDLFRKVSYGAVDLFVLDTRSARNHSEMEYVSRAQLDWIKAEVKASQAPFKFIVNTVPVTNTDDLFLGIEEGNQWTFTSFKAQREELLASVTDVAGVLFLSGDFHFGGLFHVGKSKALDPYYNIFEVLSGPGGSEINPIIKFRNGPLLRVFDVFNRQFTKILATWTYTKFTADPLKKTVDVEFIGDEGKVVWATQLDLSTPEAKITGNGWALFGNDCAEDANKVCDTGATGAASASVATGEWLALTVAISVHIFHKV